jgi:hypothetical protein
MSMRILSPFPTVPTGIQTIFIQQGPYAKEVINTELFYKVGYEDPHELGMLKGYVRVPASDPGELESAVYAVQSTVTQTTINGNVLLRLKKVEWPRNKHT